MIGVGSNRLMVCRRGGMRVTQAGRGGMEWLAGGRMPSWSSPYSAQATAALLAQFPTQWPTIRDYGWQHPEIVGYMNAYAPEDAKIAYSLVEGIGTRWLVGDGTAWINTRIKPTQYPLKIKLRGKFLTSIYSGDHGLVGCWDGSRGFFIGYTAGSTYLWTGNATIQPETAVVNTIYVLDVSFNSTSSLSYKYGSVQGSSSSVSAFSSQPIGLFGGRGNSSYGPLKGAIDKVEMKADNQDYLFIPFMRKIEGVDTMGMIDLLTGTFYGNANSSGSFSESIESPS